MTAKSPWMEIDVARRSKAARQLLFLPHKQGLPEKSEQRGGPGIYFDATGLPQLVLA